MMWVGPQRDSEEEAQGDADRHNKAVQRQYQDPASHLAAARLEQQEAKSQEPRTDSELEIDTGWEIESPFGPYYAYCDDCGGPVNLGRLTEEEAQEEAESHHTAFGALLAS